MDMLLENTIIRYIKKHYPDEKNRIIRKAGDIFPRLMEKAPDLGGKSNRMSYNMNIFIMFISYYEGSDYRIDGEAFDEIFDDFVCRYRFISPLMDLNNKTINRILKKYFYGSYQKYADMVNKKKAEGKWVDTWGMIVNPDNREEGLSFTFVGCPLAEYAKANGYQHLMSHLCRLDHAYARLMRAVLVRTHTVASGADFCDYWFVPDKSERTKTIGRSGDCCDFLLKYTE